MSREGAGRVSEMRRLTDGLLDSSRKETALQEFDLNELVCSTVEFVRPDGSIPGVPQLWFADRYPHL